MGLNTVDLFCGCGGLTQGLITAGFDVRCGIDHAAVILATYKQNFHHPAVQHDLADWKTASEIIRRECPQCDVIAGSPPCTDFSRAGKQKEGSVASLTVAFAEVVREIRPAVVVMENVPEVLTSSVFAVATGILLDTGYSITTVVVNAKYCGVPQCRRRLFMIGALGSSPFVSATLHKASSLASHRGVPVSIREHLRADGLACPDHIYFASRNKYHPSVVSADGQYPTLRSSSGICMARKPNPLPSARPNDSASIADASELTIAQCASIASFPPTFKWPEAPRVAGVMFGNCVPPNMAARIGRAVIEAIGVGVDPISKFGCPTGVVGTWVDKPIAPKYARRKSHIDIFLLRCPSYADDACLKMVQLKIQTGVDPALVRELTYVVGTSDDGDAAAVLASGHEMKPGWTLQVRERLNQRSSIDDVYVLVPGWSVAYRGRAMMVRAGLL